MKTYYMKIRDKYIDAVRQGVKKHEYRLASPERKQIRIGDNIILISNQNKKEYVRTTVKGKTVYKDWKEALEKNWQSDFKELYSTLDDALKECYRFYTKQEVDEYGIISFDIEPCYPKLNYPLIKDTANAFILPIKAEYHTDLFPDKILKNENMHLYEGNLAHRYAIEKIYLTGAFNIKAKQGDIVLIYRMSDQWYKSYSSVVTGLAIVQDIISTKTVDECVRVCKNRSIFDELSIRALYGQYPTVVKLLDFVSFKNPVTLQQLRELSVVDAYSGPRPFTSVTKEQYDSIYKMGMEEQQ